MNKLSCSCRYIWCEKPRVSVLRGEVCKDPEDFICLVGRFCQGCIGSGGIAVQGKQLRRVYCWEIGGVKDPPNDVLLPFLYQRASFSNQTSNHADVENAGSLFSQISVSRTHGHGHLYTNGRQ